MPDIHDDRILILDFGAQYTQLIARRVRELGVYSEIYACDVDPGEIKRFAPKAVILSGGPESVYDAKGPEAPKEVFDMGVPVLGICYGMQTMAAQLGGQVESSSHREFGAAQIRPTTASRLLDGLEDNRDAAGRRVLDVWMSHGDRVVAVPPGFTVIAASDNAPFAAMADEERRLYGLQFHPEVTHSLQGGEILRRFVREIAGCAATWATRNIIEDSVARIRAQVGTDKVLLGLSGGVDSSVLAALLHNRGRSAHLRVRGPRTARGDRLPWACVIGRPSASWRLGRRGGSEKSADHRPRVHRGIRRRGGEARGREVLAKHVYPDVIESASEDRRACDQVATMSAR
jgi:GMP synthase (glutamine-hydrolysing)